MYIEKLGFFNPNIKERYLALKQNLNWIPCETHIGRTEDLHLESWLLRMLIERLEKKSEQFTEILNEYNNSWDNAFAEPELFSWLFSQKKK